MLGAARPAVLGNWRLLAQMYRSAIAGRLLYFLHRASGHEVVWRTSGPDLPFCNGDIVCESCAQVLWCRAQDPWGSLAWRGARVDDRGIAIGEDTVARRGSLFEALDRVLGLAERLPSGASAAQIRRSACELIEASSTAERHARFRQLVNVIDALRPGKGARHAHAEDAPPAVIEQLLTALRHEVAPILLDRRLH